MTDSKRRDVLRRSAQLTVMGLLVSAGVVRPRAAWADWNQPAFDAKDMAGVMKAFGGSAPAESSDIVLTAPEIAENGAVVPVAVTSKIPDTQLVMVMVEKNPNMLTALFDTSATGGLADITTRVKMGQSSDVYAVVKAGDKFFFTKKEVKVTLGGCGG